MRHVAYASLLHDRSKFASALAGVAFAATLMLVQVGLYLGFLKSSSDVVAHGGRDLWVMSRGTQVFDYGEAVSPAALSAVLAHPCVESAYPLIFGWTTLRKPSGAVDNLVVIGSDIGAGPMIPWSMRDGLPSDLNAPMRVAVDAGDLARLQLPPGPLGARLEVGGKEVYVAAVTDKIRAFTLTPYLFAGLDTSRRLLGIADGRSTFYTIELADKACVADVIKAVESNPDLQAVPHAAFVAMTQKYWIDGSGAGAMLGLSAILGLVVGAVIVGQTLYSLTKDHHRELATLKAMGASGRQLAAFVLWQAALLASLGGVLGMLVALWLGGLAEGAGMNVVLTAGVVASGLATIATMCGLASWWSVSRVLSLDAAEVFK
jgi:putative ABC transport system permease protein